MAADRRNRPDLDLRRFLTGRAPGQSRVHAGSGEVVAARDAPDSALFYIEEGWIRLSTVSAGGKEVVLVVRSAGSFFGTRSLL